MYFHYFKNHVFCPALQITLIFPSLKKTHQYSLSNLHSLTHTVSTVNCVTPLQTCPFFRICPITILPLNSGTSHKSRRSNLSMFSSWRIMILNNFYTRGCQIRVWHNLWSHLCTYLNFNFGIMVKSVEMLFETSQRGERLGARIAFMERY